MDKVKVKIICKSSIYNNDELKKQTKRNLTRKTREVRELIDMCYRKGRLSEDEYNNFNSQYPTNYKLKKGLSDYVKFRNLFRDEEGFYGEYVIDTLDFYKHVFGREVL